MGLGRVGSRGVSRALLCGVAAASLILAACGSDDDSTATGTDSTAEGGETVKVGVLQSLSGTMSISEVAVKNSQLLAIKEINDAGGVLDRQIEPIVEDGESKPEVFAQKV